MLGEMVNAIGVVFGLGGELIATVALVAIIVVGIDTIAGWFRPSKKR